MACGNCIKALEGGAHTLYELHFMTPEELPPVPPMTSWAEVAEALVRLAGHLRTNHQPTYPQGTRPGED